MGNQNDRTKPRGDGATTGYYARGFCNAVSRLALMAAGGMVGLPALSSSAWAQCVPNGSLLLYTCSGTNTTSQSVVADPALQNVTVTTTGGFSVDTTGTGGTALSIEGTGEVRYLDTNASSLTAQGGGYGLLVRGFSGGDVAVVTGGTIQGSSHGIWAAGSSGASVTATGTVTSTGGVGIQAYTTSGDLTVSAGQVSGVTGIFAEHTGSGTTSVTATGLVTGTSRYGILATHGVPIFNPDGSVASVGSSSATDLIVSAASVTGGIGGIYAYNNGTGVTRVTATGQVTGTAGDGVFVRSQGAGITVYVTGVTGGNNGIDVSDDGVGSGTVSVTARGAVTGTAGTGVKVYTSTGHSDLLIDTMAVSGAVDGIRAEGNGSGVTSVLAQGAVTATTGRGIIAFGRGTDVRVEAQAVTGGSHGIAVANVAGSGVTSVIAHGAVSGSIYGIVAENARAPGPFPGGVPTDVSVDAVDVTGGVGIHVKNVGTGSTRVTATGHVQGTGTFGLVAINGDVNYNPDLSIVLTPGGVPVVGASNAVDLTVDAASVTGVNAGIYAYNNGTGITNVKASGSVLATGFANGAGIVALNGAGASDLTVNAADVTGDRYGMIVANAGTGATKVGASGSVEGGYVGILAINGQFASDILRDAFNIPGGPGGTDLNVDVNKVSGSFASVYAYNKGTGDTSVTVRDHAQGTVFAYNAAATKSLAIDVTSVEVLAGSGNVAGVYARNDGTGGTGISATGPISAASTTAGIFAYNGTTTHAGLQINADAAVTGRTYGIVAANAGEGHTYVEAKGPVQGDIGILAVNGQVDHNDLLSGHFASAGPSLAQDLVVQATQVTGDSGGIYARNHGTGQTSVIATGAVVASGPLSAGIFAANGTDTAGAGTNLDVIATGGVSGFAGVVALNYGAGDTMVQTRGLVSGFGGFGLRATNGASAPNLTVDAENISGAVAGIYATNAGAGETKVGAIDVRASEGTAVVARGNGTRLTVTVLSAIGAESGIAAINNGSADTGVGSQVARGGSGHGIDVTNAATATGVIIDAGTATGGAAGNGIRVRNNGTDQTLIFANGLVEGGAGAISAFSAGQPIIIKTSGLVRNLSQLSNAVAIEAGGGLVGFNNSGGLVGTVQFGAHTLADMGNNAAWNTAGGSNAFGGGQLTNAAGIVITAAGNGGVAETTTFNDLAIFTNRGLLTMMDGGAGDITRQSGGNARFEAGSALAIDIGGAGQADRFITSGTADITGARLAVNAAGPMAAYGARYTVLSADGGLTGRFASLSGLPANTAFLTITDTYDANNAYLDVTKYRNFADAGWTPNQISTGRGLDSLGPGPVVNAVAALTTDAQARNAFDQLSGEVHASARTALIEDSRFVRNGALDRLRSAFDTPGAIRMPIMSYAQGGPTSMRVAPPESFAIWGQAYGSWGRWNSDGNAARLNRSTGGFTVGVDTLAFSLPSLPVRIGLLAGYSNTSFNVANRASSGSSDNYHMGLYGGTQWGALGLRAGVIHTWHDIRTNRVVAFNGFNDSLRGIYDGRTTQVFGDLGYRIEAGRFGFEPFANLAYVNLRTNGLREMGGAAVLTSPGKSMGVAFSTLGLRASSQFDIGGMAVTARGMLGWRHAFGAVTPNMAMRFASGGDIFSIGGVPIARNAAVVEAGLDVALSPNAALGVSYGGQFGSSATDQTFRANFNMKF